jgi:hypothetical protein
MKATNSSRQFMKTAKSTDTTVMEPFSTDPSDAVIKMMHVNARMTE